MFYRKTLEIIDLYDGSTDDDGIYHIGDEYTIKSITCDIQPYSSALLYRDYGYNEQVTKRVFCNLDADIKTGMIVKFENYKFKIIKIIEWDDYMELAIDDE